MAIGASRVFHVNVNCSSLERSLAFYRDALGLEAGARTAPADVQPGEALGWEGSCRWDAWILIGDDGFAGAAIDLLEWKTPEPIADPRPVAERTGFARVAVAVADLEACRESLLEAGATLHAPATGAAGGAFLAADPDGTEIELREGAPSGIAGVRIACHDLAACARFYREVLGFRDEPEPARGPGASAAVLLDPAARFRVALAPLAAIAPGEGADGELGEHPLHGSRRQRTPRPMQALGIHRMALLTDDVARDHATLTAAGVRCLTPPVEMSMGPGLPSIRFFCFLDPEGTVLELIEQPGEG